MHHCPSGSAGDRLTTAVLLCLVLMGCITALQPARGQSPAFAAGVAVGTNTSSMIWEASGLVASRQNPGVLWTHNDSGYRGNVFAISTNGALLGRYFVSGVFSGDFEDIARGPGPLPQFQYIYLGDIGDNFLSRESIRVFRFPEPAVYAFQSNAPVEAPVFGAEEIVLSYPDGPFNAEAMMIDSSTGDLYIATKHTNECRIYRATQEELGRGGTVVLTFVASPAFRSASAADMSVDGSLIVIRRPGRGSLWVRQPGQSVADALKGTPIPIPVIGQPTEPNGEAIAFEPNGQGYYTISEGFTQPIYYFARTDGSPPAPRVLVAPGVEWEVNDFGEPLPRGWTTNLDPSCLTAPAPLGSGGGERSTLESRVPTTYFLHRFTNSNSLTNLALAVSFTDGLAVYLNGTEIFRRHLTPDAVFDEFALASNADESRYWFSVPVNPNLLRPGENVIAAELHRFEPEGPVLNFDLQLFEGLANPPAALTAMQLADGNCVGVVRGAAGLAVDIDRSQDLLTWSPATIVVLTNGVATFAEPATNGSSFYRIHPAAEQ